MIVEPPASEAQGNSKKRRRRKKKKGEGQGGGDRFEQQRPERPERPERLEKPHFVQVHHPAAAASAAAETHAAPLHEGVPAPAMHAVPRPKLDGEEVAKKAWKIFLAEVSEEGLALIGDQDARELSRRSFRLAEIFLEEASRRQR